MPIDRIKVFKALGDESRLKIIESLFGRELSVSEITEYTGIQYSQVSHHLSILRNAGIVADTRMGKYVVYKINPELLHSEYRKERSLDFNCCTIEFSDNKLAHKTVNKF